jgi:hypothetical protein
MKRLPLLGLLLFTLAALASCTGTIDSTEQTIACYDTGHGMKCVPLADLPANTTAACLDKSGETKAPAQGDSNSADTSDSGSDSNGDGNSDSSAEGDSHPSGSGQQCAAGADTDDDGISDSKDCNCTGTTNPTPPGDPGPVIQ